MILEETAEICMMLAAAFPAWRPTEQTFRTYGAVLEPLPVQAVRGATLQLLREDREFAPSAGTIYALAVKLILKAEGRGEIDAETAWGEVQGAIDHVGGYGRPTFSHPAIQKAVDAMNWQRICRDENLAATRAHFFRLLESGQRRELEDASLRLGNSGQQALSELTKRIGKAI
jgi:hypothetical protein